MAVKIKTCFGVEGLGVGVVLVHDETDRLDPLEQRPRQLGDTAKSVTLTTHLGPDINALNERRLRRFGNHVRFENYLFLLG